jgi:hypothetical protein
MEGAAMRRVRWPQPQARGAGGTPRRLSGIILVLLLTLALPIDGLAQTAPAAPPQISSFGPIKVRPGGKVTIKGTGFRDVRSVTIAGLTVRFDVRSRRRIVVTAPRTAIRGPIVVATPAGAATSPRMLVVYPTISVRSPSGPPTSDVVVDGAGFMPGEIVDLSFDAAAIGRVTTADGSLQGVRLTIPATALPGTHSISAAGRWSGVIAERPFQVTTGWPQRGFSARGTRYNRYESRLTPQTVDWAVIWVASRITPSARLCSATTSESMNRRAAWLIWSPPAPPLWWTYRRPR